MNLTEQEQAMWDLVAETGDDAMQMLQLIREAPDGPGGLTAFLEFAETLNTDRARTAAVLLALAVHGLTKEAS